MLRYLGQRLLGLLPVLAVAIVVTFAAVRALPGDPVTVMLSDHSADVVAAARLRAEYGLDRPLPEQFLRYIGEILTGQFGLSFRYVHQPVWAVLRDSLAVSPLLALGALAVALPLGAFAGVQAAMHRNRWEDTAIILVLVAGLSIPNFAIATFLVYLLAVKLALLPVAGWGTLQQAVLPVLVLAIPSAAYVARLTRTFMLEVLGQDFVRTARAKGLADRLVIYRHAFRNTLVPLVTSAGIIFGGLLSNTVVVETLFNIPGLGRLAIDSIFARDYPVAMAVVLLFVLFYALINVLVDALYALIDPRIRQGDAKGRGRVSLEAATALLEAEPAAPPRLPRALPLRRFLRQRGGVAGAVIVLIVALVALLAPLLAPFPYDETDLLNTWAPPDAVNWLGTDKLGRDIASRLIVGARVSLIVALSVLAITLTVGVAAGMAAGYFGGRTEALIMRTVDVTLAFPEVVLAILVAAVLGPGLLTVIIALSLVWWPGIARLTRSLVLVQRQELYVDAATVCGTPPFEILWRHILPNIVSPLLVRASVGIGFIIMAEATLSFLGLGVQEPAPSWGGMIRDGLPALRSDPSLAVSGSVVLGLVIIGFNLLGDGLRDALDPRLHGR